MQVYLEEVRLKKGISLSELSRMSGVSKSHIFNIENGYKAPTIPSMCKIARALDVSCSELFSCEGENTNVND